MKTKRGKKALLGISIVIVAVGFLASEAFPWGWAVHTYINDHLGFNRGLSNMNEIYGGIAPDLFNYMFSYLPFLSDQTHGNTGESNFMKVWDAAKGGFQKSLAFGFVSHNDLWGADLTAHHQCMTCGENEGYIIVKAAQLKDILNTVPEFQSLNLDDTLVLIIAHEFVEAGVDLLVKKRIAPTIGQKIVSSSLLRSPEFPFLLVKTYAQDFSALTGSTLEAAKMIISAEREFRKSMIYYGTALMQDEATALQLISQQTAAVAEGFLEANQVDLPQDTDIAALIALAIEISMEICADDFAAELKKTTGFVREQLRIHDVSYD
jgi:hypothetical protein